MKKVMLASIAVALFIPAMAFAQSNTQQSSKAQQAEQNQAAMNDETGSATQTQHTMTGMVSNNGKTLTVGNTSYIVNNPHSLKNYENQSVSVKFLFNTDSNSIHILKVNPGQ